MLRFPAVIASLLVVGCATTHTDSFRAAPPADAGPLLSRSDPGPASLLAEPAAARIPSAPERLEWPTEPIGPVSEPPAFEAVPAWTAGPVEPAADDKGLRKSRFSIKGGWYGSSEDDLDDGYIFNLSWMRFFSSLIAFEVEAGYLDADGSGSLTETEAWGIPVMVNGRLNLPVWVLNVYGGIGVGGFYYDYETKASGVTLVDTDGWAWGGNGFLGATVNLADRLAVGIEGKYYVTEELDDTSTTLDAWAVLLTIGFRR